MAQHDVGRRPIQSRIDALAQFHRGSASAKIEVFVGVESNQRGGATRVNKLGHGGMCCRTGVNPALQHYY